MGHNIAVNLSKSDIVLVNALSAKILKNHAITLPDFLKKIRLQSVPISIFHNDTLSALEAIVLYMRSDLTNKQIAHLLNRKENTISATYKNALAKHPEPLVYKDELSIPLEIFKERKLSILETICVYLNSLDMSLKQISRLLNRASKTIWTVLDRAKQKKTTISYTIPSDEKEVYSLSSTFIAKYGLSLKDVLFKVESSKNIPVSIFKNDSLSCLEAIVRYLRTDLSNSEVAHLLNRKENTISTTFKNSLEKYPGSLNLDTDLFIPIDIFKERTLSTMETVCTYLHFSHELKISQVAKLLNRDTKTIWTIIDRAKKKNEK